MVTRVARTFVTWNFCHKTYVMWNFCHTLREVWGRCGEVGGGEERCKEVWEEMREVSKSVGRGKERCWGVGGCEERCKVLGDTLTHLSSHPNTSPYLFHTSLHLPQTSPHTPTPLLTSPYTSSHLLPHFVYVGLNTLLPLNYCRLIVVSLRHHDVTSLKPPHWKILRMPLIDICCYSYG